MPSGIDGTAGREAGSTVDAQKKRRTGNARRRKQSAPLSKDEGNEFDWNSIEEDEFQPVALPVRPRKKKKKRVAAPKEVASESVAKRSLSSLIRVLLMLLLVAVGAFLATGASGVLFSLADFELLQSHMQEGLDAKADVSTVANRNLVDSADEQFQASVRKVTRPSSTFNGHWQFERWADMGSTVYAWDDDDLFVPEIENLDWKSESRGDWYWDGTSTPKTLTVVTSNSIYDHYWVVVGEHLDNRAVVFKKWLVSKGEAPPPDVRSEGWCFSKDGRRARTQQRSDRLIHEFRYIDSSKAP